MKKTRNRLLVFNCHEAWVYQLSALDVPMDIITGLQGHYAQTWDHHVRPMPPNARFVSLKEAQNSSTPYLCIITHNPTDLLDIKERTEPRILMLHLPIEARIVEEKSHLSVQEVQDILHRYVDLMGIHVVGVSSLKGKSWNFDQDIIPFGIDPQNYLTPEPGIAQGLRIANFIHRRRKFLAWDFHIEAFRDLPITLVGHNPDMNQVSPSRNWLHLKKILQHHRFYIHTADPVLEDGYNMATIEAMAAGLPVLSNVHPSSPIEHGVNGFLSDDPLQLRHYAQCLLDDPERAYHMGLAAQETVRKHFSVTRFAHSMQKAIQTAIQKCKTNRKALPDLTIETQKHPSTKLNTQKVQMIP